MQLVPADFDVPRTFDGQGFRLEPLGPEHNERDHQAWMSSIDHINATPGFEESDWPRPMSLESNLKDLERHLAEFERREAFTYSVLDGDDVIGCLYIYPSKGPDHDAAVASWVTESRAEMDVVLWREVSAWLAESWPLQNPDYAART